MIARDKHDSSRVFKSRLLSPAHRDIVAGCLRYFGISNNLLPEKLVSWCGENTGFSRWMDNKEVPEKDKNGGTCCRGERSENGLHKSRKKHANVAAHARRRGRQKLLWNLLPGGTCRKDQSFYFPAQLVGGFTLSDLLDKPRGHRCRPFSPPVRAFIFIAHRVQHSHCSSIFIECC